jgi:hypothetical protein
MRNLAVTRFSAVVAVALVLLGSAPAAAATPVSFEPYQAYGVASRAESVAIADVTADGLPDVLLSTSSYYDPDSDLKLFAFPQMPDGTLGAPVRYETDGEYGDSMSIDTGDLNRDGLADVVVEAGSLAPEGLFPLPPSGYGLKGLAVGDVNNDGKPDITIADHNSGLVVLRQQ